LERLQTLDSAEAVLGLQVCKAHLDALPLVTRPGERLGLHLPASHIAGILVKIARDFARLVPGATPRPQRADIAISFRGAVEQRAPVVHRAAGAERLPGARIRDVRFTPRADMARLPSDFLRTFATATATAPWGFPPDPFLENALKAHSSSRCPVTISMTRTALPITSWKRLRIA
jgi:hypothetical protein